MNLFSKILNIYLLFNILEKFGGPQPPLLVHDFIPAWRRRLSVNSKRTVIIIKKAGFLTTSLGWMSYYFLIFTNVILLQLSLQIFTYIKELYLSSTTKRHDLFQRIFLKGSLKMVETNANKLAR